jgi:hypothetical protein
VYVWKSGAIDARHDFSMSRFPIPSFVDVPACVSRTGGTLQHLSSLYSSLYIYFIYHHISLSLLFVRLCWPRLSRELFFLFELPPLSEFLWSVFFIRSSVS